MPRNRAKTPAPSTPSGAAEKKLKERVTDIHARAEKATSGKGGSNLVTLLFLIIFGTLSYRLHLANHKLVDTELLLKTSNSRSSEAAKSCAAQKEQQEREYASLHTKLNQMTASNKKLVVENGERAHAHEVLEEQFKNVEKENSELVEQLKEEAEAFETMRKKIQADRVADEKFKSSQDKKILELMSSFRGVQTQLSKVSAERDKLAAEKNQISKEKERLALEKKETNAMVDAYQKQLNDIVAARNTAEKENNERFGELQSQIHQVEKEKSEVAKEFADKNKEYDKLCSNFKALQKEKVEVEKQQHEANAQVKEVNEHLAKQNVINNVYKKYAGEGHVIIAAAKHNNIPDLKLLIGAGLDVTVKNGKSQTALHMVESVEAAELLLAAENGMSIIDDGDMNGWTPLIRAANMNRHEKVKFLIDKGADAKKTDIHGRTAYFHARRGEFEECVKILAPVDEDPNQDGVVVEDEV